MWTVDQDNYRERLPLIAAARERLPVPAAAKPSTWGWYMREVLAANLPPFSPFPSQEKAATTMAR